MVIWLVGMYASGKTSLARDIQNIFETEKKNVLVLNGGEIRQILGSDLNYSINDRKINAERLSRLCKFLSEQGTIVICAVLSIFEETRAWNRNNIKDYYEVFVDVSIKTLLQRDVKNLYRRALNGEIDNFVGVDIKFTRPTNPDLVVDNNVTRESLSDLAEMVVKSIRKRP
jgi:adenylylsulfate kinase-like enzyme